MMAAAPFASGLFAAESKTAGVKIERIELFPARYPMTGYFKFFAGPKGSIGRSAILIKVTASDGAVGWGQSVPIAKWSYETPETALLLLQDYYVPALIGHDPVDIAGAHRKMDEAVAPGFSTGNPITRAGIDIALHDLMGKQAGKSLAELWGLPQGKTITMNWTVNGRTIEEIEKVLEDGIQRGYDSCIIKVAPDPKFDVQVAGLVRKRLPKSFLWADANCGYDLQSALEAAPKLAELGVDVLEAPLRPNQIAGYQAIKKQGALPILMDEGVVAPSDLEEYLKLGMLDGVAMKPSRCGGLTSARRQIEILRDRGLLWLGSGLTDPDISFAATLALFGAFGLAKPAALNGLQFLTADVLAQSLKVEKNIIHVPQGAGLGIRVDQAKVDELVKQSKTT
jgi:L-alanine-DL-glutamate epimerase-like enolase superfamily enzyme